LHDDDGGCGGGTEADEVGHEAFPIHEIKAFCG
jgi:hypothetical protein